MTELIWDGKYKDGKKVAPVRIALPFQTIETINQSAADREKDLASLFATGKTNTEWKNRLIWGDKKYVLPSLLTEFAGKVNLIYIDPPFDTGANFSFKATIPDNPETEEDESIEFTKQPSMLEQKAYRDTWGKGLDSYLQWFYETVVFLRELLAENGTIYVHLDEHVGHYAKIILDEVFGYENFLNDVVWYYPDNFQGNLNRFANNHNIILIYGKSNKIKLSRIEIPLDKTKKRDVRIWDKKDKKLVAARDENGKIIYKDFDFKYADDVWSIGQSSVTKSLSSEFLNYPTQKPEELLRRVIESGSNENDLVLDCFIGSGTTVSVAEKLNRRWIACDLGRFSIHTTRKRLLGIPNVKPFIIQNLGKYERQQWMMSEAGIMKKSQYQNLQNDRMNRMEENKSQYQNLQNDRMNRIKV